MTTSRCLTVECRQGGVRNAKYARKCRNLLPIRRKPGQQYSVHNARSTSEGPRTGRWSPISPCLAVDNRAYTPLEKVHAGRIWVSLDQGIQARRNSSTSLRSYALGLRGEGVKVVRSFPRRRQNGLGLVPRLYWQLSSQVVTLGASNFQVQGAHSCSCQSGLAGFVSRLKRGEGLRSAPRKILTLKHAGKNLALRVNR